MLLNVIFLLLITSLAALILLNGTKNFRNHNSTLKAVALLLAEEQFAEIESLAAEGNLSAGNYNFLGVESDLKNYFDDNLKKNPVEFKVSASVENYSAENLFKVAVLVEWKFDKKNYSIELKKIVRGKKNYEQVTE